MSLESIATVKSVAEHRKEGSQRVETGKTRVEPLGAAVRTEVGEDDTSYLLRVVLVKRENSLKREVMNLKLNHYSLMVGLKLKQIGLERVRGEMKQKGVLVESPREAAKIGTVGE